MLRALFEKKGNAVWMSHLDLMRLFQRAFQRAGLPLTHTQGFNPRPSVSIAMPLSVGVESVCELLDFQLDGMDVPCDEIMDRLNAVLIDGVCILAVYADGKKLKDLALLKAQLYAEYDNNVPHNAASELQTLFNRNELWVEKKSKNGVQEQNIIPMCKSIQIQQTDEKIVTLEVILCCQNPSLNPMQLSMAIGRYLPELAPDFVRCTRMEIYDHDFNIFR